jgi:tetratricopeptide (TPR) repeat protein
MGDLHARRLVSRLALVWALVAWSALGLVGQKQPARTQGGASSAEVAQALADGQEAMSRGDFPAAAAAYGEAVRLAPQVAEFHSDLGLALYSNGQSLEASREFAQALKLKPALTASHYFLGASLAESGQCQAAMPYLEKYYPRVEDHRLKRALGLDGLRCSMALNQPDRVVATLQKLGRDFPDDPDVLYYTSHIYSDLSTHASERLLSTAPGSLRAHQLNAEVMELQGKLGDAEAEYRKVLKMNPRLPGIHYRLGRLSLADPKNALEEARKEFEEELKVDPASAPAEYELGEIARQARDWNGAIEHFSRAVKLDPEFTEADIGLGKSLISSGRAEEAVAPLEAAVKLDPQDPVAHYQLSFAYRRLGRSQDAEREMALYRETAAEAARRRESIRAGILGRTSQEQKAEPPE